MLYASIPNRLMASAPALRVDTRLTPLERAALLLSVVEIPLSIDKVFFYDQRHASLGAVGGLCISITTISLVTLYTLWFAAALLHRRRMVARPLFGVPMLFYLAIVLMSAAVASVPILSLFDFAVVLQAYLLFFFVANRIQTHEDLLFCLSSLAASVLLESSTIFYSAAIGMDNEELAIGPLVLTVWDGNRYGGTLNSPVLAGSTLALMWLPVASSLLFIRSKWSWRFAMLATTAGLLAILLTQTRGAILTSAVGAFIIGVGMLSRGWLPKWTIAIAAFYCALSLYPLFLVYQKRIQFGDGGSASGRVYLSKIALETISESPLIGFGAGNCHLATQTVADQAKYRALWYYTIHCKYLLVWIETGIIGLLAFLAILGNGLRYGISAWRTRDPALSVLALGLIAALAGHMVHMLVDIFNSLAQVQMLWFVLGLAAATYKLAQCDLMQCSPGPVRRAGIAFQHQGTSLANVSPSGARQFDGDVF